MGIVNLSCYSMFLLCKKVPLKANTIINEIFEIDASTADSAVHLKLDIIHKEIHQLQWREPFCKRIMNKQQTSKSQPGNPFYIESELLMKNVADKTTIPDSSLTLS